MSETKYYIKSTVTGSQSYETYTDDITAAHLTEWSDEIKEFIENEKTELAQYIDDRYSCIQGVVTEIYVGVTVINGEMYGLTEITATRELSDDEKDALCQYLKGQFSDGWGEGVEQREFTTEIVTEEEECYDEDEDYCYTEEYDVTTYLYIHFWQSEGFKMEFIDIDDVNNTPNKPTKPVCKLVGADGNIFNLLKIAGVALIHAGLREQNKEMLDRATKAESYDKALQIIMEYVEVM